MSWEITGNEGIDPTTNFLGTTDSEPLIIKTDSTEQLRVTEEGKIGISTTEPLFKTHISGGSGAPTAEANGPGTLFIGDNQNGNNGSVLIGYLNNGYSWIQSYGVLPLLINPVGNNTILNLANGNVGIGTDSPGARLDVVGDIHATGTKNFVQAHPTDPTKEIVYAALEGGEAGTYTRGTWKLDNGQAVIKLPEDFGLVTSEDGLTVQFTPRGEWLQLYVVRVNTQELVVQENQGKSGLFDYIIQGVRKGYEHHKVIQERK